MSLVENFERMLSQGQDSALLRFSLGQAYYKERNFSSAIAHLRAALGLDATYSAAWKLLGRAYSDAGDLKSALESVASNLGPFQSPFAEEVMAASILGMFERLAYQYLIWQDRRDDLEEVGRDAVAFIVGGIRSLLKAEKPS